MGVADTHLSSGNRTIPAISIAEGNTAHQLKLISENGYRVSSCSFDWLSEMNEIKRFLSIIVTKISIQWKWGGWALLRTEFTSVRVW